MRNIDLLERAFALAESGKCKDLHDVREALRSEGATHIDLYQLCGRSLMSQLRGRVAAARERRETSVQ